MLRICTTSGLLPEGWDSSPTAEAAALRASWWRKNSPRSGKAGPIDRDTTKEQEVMIDDEIDFTLLSIQHKTTLNVGISEDCFMMHSIMNKPRSYDQTWTKNIKSF